MSQTEPYPREGTPPIYALIDPFFGEPPFIDMSQRPATEADVQAAREAAWQRQVLCAPTSTPPVDWIKLPYLVRMPDESDSWLKPLCALAREQHGQAMATDLTRLSLGGFIETRKPAARLMAQLHRLWCLPGSSKAGRYLRIASPRVLELLRVDIGEPDLHRYLTGGTDDEAVWHFYSREGSWRCIAAERDVAEPPHFGPRTSITLAARLRTSRLVSLALNSAQRNGWRCTDALITHTLRWFAQAGADAGGDDLQALDQFDKALAASSLQPDAGDEPGTSAPTPALPDWRLSRSLALLP